MSEILEKKNKLFNLLLLLDDESSEIQKIIRQEFLKNAQEMILNQEIYLKYLANHQQREAIFKEKLSELHYQLVLEAFSRILSVSLDEVDLEASMLVLSYWHSPDISCLKIRSKLHQLAQRTAREIPSREENLHTILKYLKKVMFVDHDFRGNSLDYYNPENSFLHKILETGLGIPISLSVLFILIGYRLNLPIIGVCMPAHFILKLDNGREEIFFDPFRNGKIYSRQSCLEYLNELNSLDSESILNGCSNIDTFKRILKNLHIAYSSHTVDPGKVEDIDGILRLYEAHQ